MNAPSETETVVVQPPASTEAAASAPLIDSTVQETPEAKQQRERDEAGRFRNPLQPRIDELTRARHNSDRETAYWKQRAEAAEKPPAPPKEKPTAEKYDNYGEYVEALTDWKAEEKVKAEFATRDEETAKRQTTEKRATNWSERETQTRTSVADYDEVMRGADVTVAQHVIDQLLESEEGPRIAYHLAQHPDVAEKLNAMTEVRAAREIGRLEALVAVPVEQPAAGATPAAQPPAAPAAKPPRTTTAPPPAKPVTSGRSATVQLDKMGMDEYVATRKTQGASWARR